MTEKNVLDLTKEELEQLSTEELIKLRDLCQYYEDQYNIGNLAKKVLINGLYGAITKNAFIVYNMFVAAAITSNGRYFIQKLGKYLEKFLQDKLPNYKPYWAYTDTDSTVYDTKIYLRSNNHDKVMNIGDFYNSIKSQEIKTLSGNLVKKVDNILTPSVSKNLKLEDKPIKYVMKHTVSKRMFTIKTKNKSVTVTEDHSIMVLRDGKLISCKVKDIHENDKICILNDDIDFISDFEIIDEGIQELNVYDLEVEDNHNFFGNDILLHNSVYFQIAPYVDAFCKQKNTDDLIDKINFCDKFTDNVLQKIVDQCIHDFTTDFNAFDPKYCGCKREIIADTMIWCEKKHYYGRERADESGIFPISSPEIKTMGIDLKKSTTSAFAKKHITDLLDIIFDSDEDTLRNAISDLKEEFYEASIDDIAMIGSCSSLDYNLGEKNVPFGVRASLVYNKFIADKQLNQEYSLISQNEKTKRVYLCLPNQFDSNVIAYLDKKFASKYLKQCIDYELMFEKSFLSLVKNMVESIGYNLDRLNVLEDW